MHKNYQINIIFLPLPTRPIYSWSCFMKQDGSNLIIKQILYLCFPKERGENYQSLLGRKGITLKLKDNSEGWRMGRPPVYNQHWSILSLPPSYSKRVRICHLCLMEKTHISLADPRTTLNKMKLLPSAATGTRCIFNTGDFSPCYLRINCQLHTTTNKNPPPCPTANFLV